MTTMQARYNAVILLLLIIVLTLAGLAAYIIVQLQECSKPGFRPVGCPIVIHIGKR